MDFQRIDYKSSVKKILMESMMIVVSKNQIWASKQAWHVSHVFGDGSFKEKYENIDLKSTFNFSETRTTIDGLRVILI